MPAARRSTGPRRWAALGQHFSAPRLAEQLAATAGIGPGELVVEIGAGSGVLTRALARRGARVLAVEIDRRWARRLEADLERRPPPGAVEVICTDFTRWRLPDEPFVAVGSLPFGATTAILRHLLDQPLAGPARGVLALQWEVARKRAASPPDTLLSTTWAPWWTFSLGHRVPARHFDPPPSVDAGILILARRDPPLLPPAMAGPYTAFVRSRWPFERPRHRWPSSPRHRGT